MASPNIPSISTFDEVAGEDRSTIGVTWEKWIDRFENYMGALDISDDTRKRKMLLHLIGPNSFEDFQTFTETGTDFETAKEKLGAHFKPKVIVDYEISVFRAMKQKKNETIDQYNVRLQQQASRCDFGDGKNKEVKRHIVTTTSDSRLRLKGLRGALPELEDVLREGRSNELCKLQSADIERNLKTESRTVQSMSHSVSRNKQCRNCGGIFPHPNGKESCPAYGKECRSCRRPNHFAAQCRSTGRGQSHGQGYQQGQQPRYQNQRFSRGRGRGRSRGRGQDRGHRGRQAINEVSANVADNDDDDENYLFSIDLECDDAECISVNKNSVNKTVLRKNVVNKTSIINVSKPPKFNVTLNECPVTLTADSAATCSVIDEVTFNGDLCEYANITLTKDKINPYSGDSIEPLGKFKAVVKSKGRESLETFYVVPGKSGCLLSVGASLRLGLLKIARHVLQGISSVKSSIPVSQQIIQNKPHLFQGIGKAKNVKVKLHINENVKPVARRYKSIPFHMQGKLEVEVKRLVDLDILEYAEGPTPWISPAVLAPKPNNEKEVRLCIDMRSANQAIERERHPMPTIEDIQHKVNGWTVFSKLDLRSGYHQLELDEESRYITTFATHIGLLRYKRLNFGINCASEIFQNAIAQTIDGVGSKDGGALNISDDIIVGGRDKKSHDIALLQVAERLDEAGYKLNLPKCEFDKCKIEFYGMTFSEAGMEPSPKRLEALLQMTTPQTPEEVQSLLGMVTYSSRFIPNFSTIAEPLRRLTHQDTKFVWRTEQQQAFDKLKQHLAEQPVIAYFDVNRQTEIVVDASPVGLGGILAQFDEEGLGRVVAYASRSLTDVERRYAQIEREALAVVWACERFHVYIYGSPQPIIVVTDHKPLLHMYGNPNSKLPMRIERWSLRLQPYDIVLRYRRGKENPADYLSRHPLEDVEATSREQQIAEEYINFVALHAIPKAMTQQEVLKETKEDPTLSMVKELIKSGKWYMINKPAFVKSDVDFKSLQSYGKLSGELSLTQEGLVLKGSRIALPDSLQKRAVELAHEGHQGVNKTKSLLREKVWFPGIDMMVKERVGRCVPCQATFDPRQREPLQMSKLPERPWSHLSTDFYGPLPSGHYLLVIRCDRSRFPEVEVLGSTSANVVIPAMDKLFSSRGIPDKLKSDNGTPFQSAEFAQFAEVLGFEHQKVTPYWPEANGGAENFMKNLGKVCRSAQVEGKPWRKELQKYLRNYRATPHSTTGIPPATALNGYPLKTKLPEIAVPGDESKIDENDKIAKANMKRYAERRRNIRDSDLKVGEKVIMKNVTKTGKLQPKFHEDPFEVIQKKGSMIVAQRGSEVKARNSSHFRKVKIEEEPILIRDETQSEMEESQMDDRAQDKPPQTAPSILGSDRSQVVPESPGQRPQPPRSPHTQTQTPQPIPRVRPQREIKTPKYLSDFEVKIPKLSGK